MLGKDKVVEVVEVVSEIAVLDKAARVSQAFVDLELTGKARKRLGLSKKECRALAFGLAMGVGVAAPHVDGRNIYEMDADDIEELARSYFANAVSDFATYKGAGYDMEPVFDRSCDRLGMGRDEFDELSELIGGLVDAL